MTGNLIQAGYYNFSSGSFIISSSSDTEALPSSSRHKEFEFIASEGHPGNPPEDPSYLSSRKSRLADHKKWNQREQIQCLPKQCYVEPIVNDIHSKGLVVCVG